MAESSNAGTNLDDYDSAISYLYDLEFFGVKFGLENTRELLRRLGDPHLAYPTIHVTGTNGKGSVCAFIESALRAAGYKTGLYTSPHLVDFTERTKVNGKEIPREDVARLASEVKRHVVEMAAGSENQQCTFFEATTALAFKHFAERKVDVAVIEVGMGGRLDSTNHIVPEASVITSIGLEHTQYLGDTEAKIAYEKAGIIKAGMPVVVGDLGPEAMAVVERVAKDRGARILRIGRDFDFKAKQSVKNARNQRFSYGGFGNLSGDYEIPLLGEFQLANAAMALAALEAAGRFKITREAATKGLKKAVWPGRLQIWRKKPLVVLDGGHNPHGALALAKTISSTFEYGRLIVVVGMMKDKDQRGYLDAIVPLADEVIATRPRYARAIEPEKLATMVEGKPVRVAQTIADALALAADSAKPGDMVLVCGSLFVVGEALAILGMRKPEPRELVARMRKLYGVGAFPGRDVGGNEDVEIASRDPFQVLISTILSQRTRDENTHRASVALFGVYDTAGKLAQAPLADVERLVRPSGFYRMKAKYIKEAAAKIVTDFNGQVPQGMDKLLTIPAVGRKTANCVLVYGFGIPAIPVDVHVHRISNRLGLVDTDEPEETEAALEKAVPRRYWIEINRLMVRHGQETCLPRNPKCQGCDLRDVCHHNLRLTLGPWLGGRYCG
jgi:dihydrofolate synthase/folylpolyglutamate synthase